MRNTNRTLDLSDVIQIQFLDRKDISPRNFFCCRDRRVCINGINQLMRVVRSMFPSIMKSIAYMFLSTVALQLVADLTARIFACLVGMHSA